MLCPQFILYLSSFVGTLEKEIPGAALEPCQLKNKQFLPDILKFSTKHKENPFTLNYSVVPCIFFGLYFMQAHIYWVLIVFGTQLKRKNARFGPCFQTIFCFLWLWSIKIRAPILCTQKWFPISKMACILPCFFLQHKPQ